MLISLTHTISSSLAFHLITKHIHNKPDQWTSQSSLRNDNDMGSSPPRRLSLHNYDDPKIIVNKDQLTLEADEVVLLRAGLQQALKLIDDKTFDTKKKRPVMHTFFDLVENVGAESSQQKLIDVWTKSWQG